MLNWSDKIWFKEKKKKIIGFNLSSYYKMNGRIYMIDGLCISRKCKNAGLLSSNITLKKKLGHSFLFIKFFIYFGSSFKYNIVSFTFKRKKINVARLSFVRL